MASLLFVHGLLRPRQMAVAHCTIWVTSCCMCAALMLLNYHLLKAPKKNKHGPWYNFPNTNGPKQAL